jgi:hypothetical protein
MTRGAGSKPAAVVLALALLVAIAGCASNVPPPAAATASAQAAEAAWSRVLARHVNARGEVAFAELARDRGDLDVMVRHVADTPLDSLANPPHKLAHMINAYNALSMFNVIDSGIPATHDGANKLRFFVLRRFDIGGQWQSLYSFENDVIRPYARSVGEPRVHFALNCSARACPVLPRAPFSAATLDAQLQRETLAFFARPINFRIDAPQRSVWLSEILDFYAEDFVPVHSRTLAEYANLYVSQPAPADYRIRFTPFDWTIANSASER